MNNDDAKELWNGEMKDFVGEYVNVGKMTFRVVGIYKAIKADEMLIYTLRSPLSVRYIIKVTRLIL